MTFSPSQSVLETINELNITWYNNTDEFLIDESLIEEPNEQVPCSHSMFFLLVYGPMYGLVCGFGLIGNTLSFAVLHKYSRGSVSTYLLKTLAVMDNIFLATAAFVQMYPAMTIYSGRVDQLTPIYKYFQALAWPLAHTVQLGSVWMMVLVAANRYIAVCRPLHAARLCSKRHIRLQIIIVLLCTVVFNLPRFAEYNFVIVNVTQTDVITNTTKIEPEEINMGLASSQLYNILYENVAYCLFAYLLPLAILIVLNVHLVRELRRARHSRQTLIGRSSADENNITFVLIVVIITFIVCQTPASLNQILFYIVDPASKTTCSNYFRYYHVCNLVITINSSVNFIIYCLFRKQFQQELRALICRNSNTLHGTGSFSGSHVALRRTIILRALHNTDVGNGRSTMTSSIRISRMSSSNEQDTKTSAEVT